MRLKFNRGALTAIILMVASGICHADITYTVDQVSPFPAGPFGIDPATVSGTLQTDGTIGTLTTSNFLSWNIVVSNGIGGSFDLTSGDSTLTATGTATTATATTVQFSFGPSPGTSPGALGYFEILDSTNGWGWALAVPPGTALEAVLSDTSGSCCDAGLASFDSPITLATAVPEPASFLFLSASLGMIGVFRLERRGRQRR